MLHVFRKEAEKQALHLDKQLSFIFHALSQFQVFLHHFLVENVLVPLIMIRHVGLVHADLILDRMNGLFFYQKLVLEFIDMGQNALVGPSFCELILL